MGKADIGLVYLSVSHEKAAHVDTAEQVPMKPEYIENWMLMIESEEEIYTKLAGGDWQGVQTRGQ